MRRHELIEREWQLVEPHTLGRLGTGRDNRLFINAVLYRVRTGVAWRDLLERFGPWNTVARRFRRMGGAVSRCAGAGLRLGTGRRYNHQSALSGSRAKKSTPAAEALGRSRGGFGTKVLAVVDALGNGLHVVLPPGEAADSPQLPVLLAALFEQPGAVVADKAYDTNSVLDTLARHETEAVMPPKANRLDQRAYD